MLSVILSKTRYYYEDMGITFCNFTLFIELPQRSQIQLKYKISKNSFQDYFPFSSQTNAESTYQVMSKIPGLRPIMPQGAMYMMVGPTLKINVPI